MKALPLIATFLLVFSALTVAFVLPVHASSPTLRWGNWVDEQDMWSGEGLCWTPKQFVANYFETPPYPSALLWSEGFSPSGTCPGTWPWGSIPTPIEEADWLSAVTNNASADGLDVKILIIFFVNLSGGTIRGTPDQTTLFINWMTELGHHSNIYGAEYEPEYFGNTQAENDEFCSVITSDGYACIMNPGTDASYFPTYPVMDYSEYPYFGESIETTGSSPAIGVLYGETGNAGTTTPWNQTSVQALIDTSWGNPYVITAAEVGGPGQTSPLWSWSAFRNWIWDAPDYQADYILSTTSIGPFSVYYPYGVTLSSIAPAGSDVTSCTSGCSNGMSVYTATWTPGTILTLVVDFNSATTTLCWQYDAATTPCTSTSPLTNQTTSGVAFSMASKAYPHYATLLSVTSSTPPVTITPVVDLAGGSWSTGAFTISPSSPTSPTLVYTPPSGFSCSDSWFLEPIPANTATESSWLKGTDLEQGFTITYSQVETLTATQGTNFDLLMGTPGRTTDPCTQGYYTLTYVPVTGIECYFGVNGGTVGSACQTESVLEGTTVNFFGIAETGYSFEGWLVDGVSQGTASQLSIVMNGARAFKVSEFGR